METQIKLLKKYGITDYSIKNNKIIINSSIYLGLLTSVHKDFLKNTTINNSLYLDSVNSIHNIGIYH